MKSFAGTTDCNHTCIPCKFQVLGFPYKEYKEYTEEHNIPTKDSRYALYERFLGVSGMIASTATINTQALTENSMVCRSQRKEFGPAAGPGVVPDLLVPGPELLVPVADEDEATGVGLVV